MALRVTASLNFAQKSPGHLQVLLCLGLYYLWALFLSSQGRLCLKTATTNTLLFPRLSLSHFWTFTERSRCFWNNLSSPLPLTNLNSLFRSWVKTTCSKISLLSTPCTQSGLCCQVRLFIVPSTCLERHLLH